MPRSTASKRTRTTERALLEVRTCKACGDLDGKDFAVSEATVGLNMHPMHPNCRCFIGPYHDKEWLDRHKRNAQGMGQVPQSMTFKEWYEKYVKNNPKLRAKEQAYRNKAADREQLRRYRTVLGDNVPKSLEEFQKLKYNDTEQWRELKTRYRTRLNKNGDPLYDVFGSISKSHPDEIERILKEAAECGVEVKEGTGRMAYSPGLRRGQPGQLLISRDDSIGAWLHEEQHMLDDRADQWPGFSGLFNVERRSRMEYNAYQREITLAQSAGRQDIVDRLIENYVDEVTSFGGVPIEYKRSD